MHPRERFVGTAVALALGLAMVTSFLTVAPSVAAQPPADAWITGVVDDGVNPLEDVYVKAILFAAGNLEMGHAFTGSDGTYTIDVPGGFDYTVLAANDSYYLGVSNVKVRTGETATVDFTLDPIAPVPTDVLIKGWVKDELGNPSSAGHVLGLSWPPEGDIPWYANLTVPDAGGYYEVMVIASDAEGGAIAMDFPGYSMVENSTSGPVLSGEAYWVNITLSDGSEMDSAMIYGHVTDQDTSLPLEDALVSVQVWNEDAEVSYSNLTFTDSDGYYEMHLMDGEARIMVMKGGYSIEMFDEVEVEPDDVLQFDADLRLLDCIVSGYVTDLKSADPLRMAQVLMFDSESNIAMATTDELGFYEMDALSGTGLLMFASMEGYSDDYAYIDLEPGEEASQDFGLWPASAVLEGHVKDALTGAWMEGASVWAESDLYRGGVETDVDGFYSVELVPGTYRVGVSADGYYHQQVVDVELVDEETTVLDFSLLVLDPPLDNRVYGWVNDSESMEGLNGAHVRIGFPSMNVVWETDTDDGGYYELAVPSAEQITYVFTAWQHAPEIGVMDALGSTEYRLDVYLVPDADQPVLDYLQEPVANVSWTNPCAIAITVQEDNLREMALSHFKFWYNEDGYDNYYLIEWRSTSFDPFRPSGDLPYLQVDHTYQVDAEFNGSAMGGWLGDGTDSWYLPAYEHNWGPWASYHVLRGHYSNDTLVDELGAAFFDPETGEFLMFVFDDDSKPPADVGDLSGLFNASVNQLTVEESGSGWPAFNWDSGLGYMSILDISFEADTLVPSGDYMTMFFASDFGDMSTWELTGLTVDNDPPVADAGPDLDAVVDNEWTLNGTRSSDNVGIVSYEWDFEDGSTEIHLTGAKAGYTFTTLGSYAVTLTVTDGAGHEDVDLLWVRVLADAPPVADAGPDQEVDEGSTVVFDGSGSTDDLLEITNYTWTIVELEVDMYGEAPEYTFTVPGVYTVELVVRDSLDQESEPGSMTVTVVDVTAPVADAGPDPVGVVAWDTVTLDGSGSTDNVGIVSYAWSYDDGGPVTLSGAVVERVFANPGEFEVTLTVTDGAGLTDTDTVVVRVAAANPPPVADAGDDMTAKVGETVEFDGSGSSNDSETFTWTFEYDGGIVTLTGVQAEFVFEIPGTYIVTLNVTDEEGLWDTDGLVIIVSEDGMSTFLKENWWLLAVLAALAVMAVLLVLMKGGKKTGASPGPEPEEEMEDEEDLPPPDDEDL